MLYYAFWACALLVVYTYVGYALIIYLLAKYRSYSTKKVNVAAVKSWPKLTLCIAAYNEEEVIPMKMENSLALDYPADRLSIVWVTDGSTDNSNALLSTFPGVQVLYHPARLGKTEAINHAMREITTSFVVFTDANCLLSKDALKVMMAQFEDPQVGCVAGEKRVAYYDDDASSSKGEGFYWEYESKLKKWDYAYYSTVGAAGELYAIRSALYKPIAPHILLDDFMISMDIALGGYRIAYSPEAYAVERGSLNIEEEEKRKVRIAAGGWQSVWLLRSLLNIFKYGKLSFQYVSHRVLRWTVTPFALFLLLPLNFAIAFLQNESNLWYVILFFLQLAFYMLTLIGYLKRNEERINTLFFVPFYFMFMNYNVLKGLIYLTNKSNSAVWEKSMRK